MCVISTLQRTNTIAAVLLYGWPRFLSEAQIWVLGLASLGDKAPRPKLQLPRVRKGDQRTRKRVTRVSQEGELEDEEAGDWSLAGGGIGGRGSERLERESRGGGAGG